MNNDLFECLKNCIESYPPDKRGEVTGLLFAYAEDLKNGTLDEYYFEAKALELKAKVQ